MMDCFDLLYEEGAEHPKMMAINLHDRLIGRPAKAVGLIKFLEHASKHDRVWPWLRAKTATSRSCDCRPSGDI